MSVSDEYLATVTEPKRTILEHMYDVIRQTVPESSEITSYDMPTFTYDGKSFLAIVATKKGMSLYPFCSTANLGIDLSAFSGTKASVHFTVEQLISDDLLRAIIRARLNLTD